MSGVQAAVIKGTGEHEAPSALEGAAETRVVPSSCSRPSAKKVNGNSCSTGAARHASAAVKHCRGRLPATACLWQAQQHHSPFHQACTSLQHGLFRLAGAVSSPCCSTACWHSQNESSDKNLQCQTAPAAGGTAPACLVQHGPEGSWKNERRAQHCQLCTAADFGLAQPLQVAGQLRLLRQGRRRQVSCRWMAIGLPAQQQACWHLLYHACRPCRCLKAPHAKFPCPALQHA